MKKWKKHPLIVKVILLITIISIIAAFVELVFDPNPIVKNEKNSMDYFSFDVYDDIMQDV